MRNKLLLVFVLLFVIIAGVLEYTMFVNSSKTIKTEQIESVSVKPVSSDIAAEGAISPQNKATLHFQTSGKLVLLPFKEGDSISQGQTIAQLDTYALQRQLAQALNAYKSTRNVFDQTQQNAQDNVLQNQQKPLTSGATMDQNNAINDAVSRIVNENQANLDTAVVNVELANYALQLSTLSSPLTGIVTHEDVTTAYVNVTPLTSFTIVDPSSLVFQANVSETDIDYVSEGAQATVTLVGTNSPISGTVVKIYPEKVQLTNGQKVYHVDIQSDEIKNKGKLDQSGTVLIKSNSQENMTIVPAWTVLAKKYIWIEDNGVPKLKPVQVGKIHGSVIEVTGGLTPKDTIIVDPKSIPSKEYQML